MSQIRTILIEGTTMTAMLIAGMTGASTAFAAPLPVAVQAGPQAASTEADISISSSVMVERTETNGEGLAVTQTFEPSEVKVIPGDTLIFVNNYKNTSSTPATGFVVNNPVHPAVTFTSVAEDWATVSVDGGQTFGPLESLTVMAIPEVDTEDASEEGPPRVAVPRPATPADVTNIRWQFDRPIAPGASGELRFRGTVR